MLVDMGDLPEPDTGVLSENLFPATLPEGGASSAATSSSAGASHHHQQLQPKAEPGIDHIVSHYPGGLGTAGDTHRQEPPADGAPRPSKALTPGDKYYPRDVHSSAESSSHLYGSRGQGPWGGSGEGDMHAVTEAGASGSTAHPEGSSSRGGGHLTSAHADGGVKSAYSALQGGGSLLQNMNGRRGDVKDYSLITGLPNTLKTAAGVVVKSEAAPNGSLTLSSAMECAATSLYYQSWPNDDSKSAGYEAISKHNIKAEPEERYAAPGSSTPLQQQLLKRKLEGV